MRFPALAKSFRLRPMCMLPAAFPIMALKAASYGRYDRSEASAAASSSTFSSPFSIVAASVPDRMRCLARIKRAMYLGVISETRAGQCARRGSEVVKFLQFGRLAPLALPIRIASRIGLLTVILPREVCRTLVERQSTNHASDKCLRTRCVWGRTVLLGTRDSRGCEGPTQNDIDIAQGSAPVPREGPCTMA